MKLDLDGVIQIPRGHSTISVEKLVYAPLKNDTIDGVEYGKTKMLTQSMIDIVVSPKIENAQQWADGGVAEDVSLLGDIDISMELIDVPLGVQKDWFGHRVDANGVILKSDKDVAPYFALGFRSERADHKWIYKWLYKVKAEPIEETGHTHEGGVPKFTTAKVKLRGEKRVFDNNWQATAREGGPGVKEETLNSWFKKPYEPEALPPAEPDEPDTVPPTEP